MGSVIFSDDQVARGAEYYTGGGRQARHEGSEYCEMYSPSFVRSDSKCR